MHDRLADPIESHAGFVNTWECDENAHMNVQFYARAFEVADQHFRYLSADHRALPKPADRRVRHIRFHAELNVATPYIIRSHVCRTGPYPITIIHALLNKEAGTLAASALDGYDAAGAPFLPKPADDTSVAPAFCPRSFSTQVPDGTVSADYLLQQGAAVTNRFLALPADCLADGTLFDPNYVRAFTDGASHSWDLCGLTRSWLGEHNAGRIAMEMKLTYMAPFRAGMLGHQITSVTSLSTSTFTLRHHLFDSESGQLCLIGDVTALIMDFSTRKAMAIPDDIRAIIQERLIPAAL